VDIWRRTALALPLAAVTPRLGSGLILFAADANEHERRKLERGRL